MQKRTRLSTCVTSAVTWPGSILSPTTPSRRSSLRRSLRNIIGTRSKGRGEGFPGFMGKDTGTPLRLPRARFLFLAILALGPAVCVWAASPELILHNAKVITVDNGFSIQQAIAVQGERIARVGSESEVLALKGENTEVLDLKGATVIPGLMDSHCHPLSASLVEFDHPIPQMESVADVLEYIAARARVEPEGHWIVVRQVFITRLLE